MNSRVLIDIRFSSFISPEATIRLLKSAFNTAASRLFDKLD